MILKVLILISTVFFLEGARADDQFAIPTQSADEMAATVIQSLKLYLSKARESSSERFEGSTLTLEQSTSEKCPKDVFTMTATHSQVGNKYRDGVKYTLCGRKVGEYWLEREGQGVQPLTDAQVIELDLPEPSGSDHWHFRSSMQKADIVGEKLPNGTRLKIKFMLGKARLNGDLLEIRNGNEYAMRRYTVSFFADVKTDFLTMTEERFAKPGQANSYKYLARFGRGPKNMTSGEFLELYQEVLEGAVTGLLAMTISIPLSEMQFSFSMF